MGNRNGSSGERRAVHETALFHNKFRYIDLFCGAGGLSLGLRLAGLEPAFSIDCNRAAVSTYRTNLGGSVVGDHITDEIDLPDGDIIVGGPPCQGFSSAGQRKAGDPRNTLVSCFARLIAKRRPLAFVFENVEGFLTSEDGAYVMDLLTPLIQAGYHLHLRKVNAANYGVPQHRKRVIAIGGLGWEPSFPEPTHFAYGAPGAELAGAGLPRTGTIQEALSDLPRPSIEEPGSPAGHFYRPLVGIDLERAIALRPGQDMRDLPAGLCHDSYQRRANRRVMDGTPAARRGGPPSGVRRLVPDEPSKAITGGALSEFLHPTEHRNLTLRECARLQTFPDDFGFFGNVTEQAQLIGNAVPVLLARVIGESLLKDLATATAARVEGRLLSFVPTLSNGMSPVLAHVTERVRRTFPPGRTPKENRLWD